MIEFKKLIESSVHFGHKTSRWHPRMEPFIWGARNNIHLIDVSKTAYQLEKAAEFLASLAAKGKSILWVGTKKVAQPIIEQVAQGAQSPYVSHRWLGGTLTNHINIKKLITKYLHFEDILAKSDQFFYTKKELALLQKQVDRLRKNVASIKNLSFPVGALVIVDVKKEQTALREAIAQNIPVVALVDTNNDPSMVDYVIPANDDAQSSIKVILEYLGQAVVKAKEQAKNVAMETSATEEASEEQPVALTALLSEEEDEAGRLRKKGKDILKPKKVFQEKTDVKKKDH